MWRSVQQQLQSRPLWRPLLPADGESRTSSLWLWQGSRPVEPHPLSYPVAHLPVTSTPRQVVKIREETQKQRWPSPHTAECYLLIPRNEKATLFVIAGNKWSIHGDGVGDGDWGRGGSGLRFRPGLVRFRAGGFISTARSSRAAQVSLSPSRATHFSL